MYAYSKAGLAMEIFDPEASSKFFDIKSVHGWEGGYWNNGVASMEDGSPVFQAPIDTTFAVH
jgi:hypothetical protein